MTTTDRTLAYAYDLYTRSKILTDAYFERYERQLIYLGINGKWPDSRIIGPELENPVVYAFINGTDIEGIPLPQPKAVIGITTETSYKDLLLMWLKPNKI